MKSLIRARLMYSAGLTIVGVAVTALVALSCAPAPMVTGGRPLAGSPAPPPPGCGPAEAPCTPLAPTIAPSSAGATPSRSPTVTATPHATFVHPGVLVSRGQLGFVKRKVDAGAQPWRLAFETMRASPYASLSWVSKPRSIVDCGSGSKPNNGCTDERQDAMAAYTDSLMWYLTRDSRYAQLAITLMDAWARTLRSHTNSNAPIQAGWSAANFARAGELIRYTYTGWDSVRQQRFSHLLRDVYLPEVLPGEPRSNGNHQLIELDAAAGIAVFLDDRAAFNRVLSLWRNRIPAYIYLNSDGASPHPPATSGISGQVEIVRYWQGQSSFTDGLAQETCRDFGHTGWGFDAAAHVAATAWIQGIDLYAEMRSRMVAAIEFHAAYDLGAPVPAWLCGGTVHTGLGATLEIIYNHYHRMGDPLPNAGRLIGPGRPAGANYFLAWETLTNANNPYA